MSKLKSIPYEDCHRIREDGVLEKWCTRCEKWLPCNTDYFYENPKSPDCLFPYCKECNRKKTIQWQEDNPERYFEQYTNKNRRRDEKKIQWQRNHGKEQRESGYQKQYQQKNLDKFRGYSKNRQHKNHDITDYEWEQCKKYFNHKCAYCGILEQKAKEKQGNYLHKEHYIHNGANDLSNCVPSCKSCNSSKWEFTIDEWYNNSNPKFSEKRLQKMIQWLNEDYKKVNQ